MPASVLKYAKPQPKRPVNEQGVPTRQKPLPSKPKAKASQSAKYPETFDLVSDEERKSPDLPQDTLPPPPMKYPASVEPRSPLDELKHKFRTIQAKWQSMPDEWMPTADESKEANDLQHKISEMEGPKMSVRYPGTPHKGPLDEPTAAGDYPVNDIGFDANALGAYLSSGDRQEYLEALGHLSSSAGNREELHAQQIGHIIGHALSKEEQGVRRIYDTSSTPPSNLPVGHVRLQNLAGLDNHPNVIIHSPEGKYTSFRTIVDENGDLK